MKSSHSQKTGVIREFRRASDKAVKTGRGLVTVVMFWLVPQVKLPKLITFELEAKRWVNQLPQLILKNWQE